MTTSTTNIPIVTHKPTKAELRAAVSRLAEAIFAECAEGISLDQYDAAVRERIAADKACFALINALYPEGE